MFAPTKRGDITAPAVDAKVSPSKSLRVMVILHKPQITRAFHMLMLLSNGSAFVGTADYLVCRDFYYTDN
jgi:hypothetical protein